MTDEIENPSENEREDARDDELDDSSANASEREGEHAGAEAEQPAASADLTAEDLLEMASQTLRRRRLEEVEELQVLAAWADLHSEDGPGGLLQLGGEGTPGVRDYAMGEIALARAAGVVSTMNATADVLDLRHRLPLTWEKTKAGATDVWIARKIAKMTRHLPLDRVWVVDQAIAAILGRHAPSRILAVAEGKVIEADPDLHHQRVAEEQQRRFVRLGRADEHGLRTLIARLDSGDAAWIHATLTRVTEILTPRYDQTCTADEIRAKALGYLARPAELLILLLEHTEATDTEATGTDDSDASGSVERDAGDTADAPADAAGADEAGSGGRASSGGDTNERDPAADPHADPADNAHTNAADGDATEDTEGTEDTGSTAGPTNEVDETDAPDTPAEADEADLAEDPATTGPALNRALAFPVDLLARLKEVDWTKLAPKHTLYIHLHQTVLDGTTPGAARIEGLPATTLAQLHGLLAGAKVTVKPVIDLNDEVRTDAYEHPESLKERVHLIHGGDYWPWAGSVSRHLDYDHIRSYDPNGPPGQTGTQNSAPIGRRHHRYKTLAGYQVRQFRPHRYIWTTPGGQSYLVDHHGTRPIDKTLAETIINAPPGIDYYPGPPGITYDIQLGA